MQPYLLLSPFFSSFLPDLCATILGISVTFLIYKVKEFSDERNRKDKRFQYSKFLVNKTIETIEKNIIYLKNNIDELESNPNKINPIEQSVNGDLRRILNNLDLEDLSNIISKKSKHPNSVKQFQEFISLLDYFQEMNVSIGQRFKIGMINDYNRRTSYNNSFIQAGNSLPNLIEYYKGKDININGLADIQVQMQKEGRNNDEKWDFPYQTLAIPVINFLHKNKIKDDPHFYQFCFLFERVANEYDNFQAGNKSFNKETIEEYESMKSNLSVLLKYGELIFNCQFPIVKH